MSPWILVAGCATAAVVAGLLLMRRGFIVVQVTGTSMCPALMPGDRVLVRRGVRHELRAGLIVVFGHPRDECMAWDIDAPPARNRWVIKRVAAVPGDMVPDVARPAVGGAVVVPPGMLVVLGDNVGSADSRSWGFLPSADVRGVAVRRLRPSSRVG